MGANPLQLQDANGNPTAHLLSGGLDEWFALTRAGSTQHYLTDALGSTVRLTDAQGAKLADYTYDPYGGSSNDTPALGDANAFQYTGRENDGVAGLYFYRARYYKPAWGRFISADPIGLAGGPNLFAYVNGNPISYVDPDGKQATVVLGGGGLAAGGSAGAGGAGLLNPAGAVIGAGLAGYGVGTLLNPYIQPPLSQAVDWCVEKITGKEKKRCEKVMDDCIDRCSKKTLPTRDYGVSFGRCLNQCLVDNGCKPTSPQ